jgi:hypothetical protein
MGMDIYGLNPTRNTAKTEILIQYTNDEGLTEWDAVKADNKLDEYLAATNAWEEDNPGEYFRNNVWWWRPLWDYICTICHDILDDEDCEEGHHNGGHQINEKKAIAIAGRIDLFIKNGDAADFAIERQQTLDALEDEECQFCEGTGKRDDQYVKGECNGCQGKGTRRPYATQYPFDLENLEWFGKFCKQSGGFEIC